MEIAFTYREALYACAVEMEFSCSFHDGQHVRVTLASQL